MAGVMEVGGNNVMTLPNTSQVGVVTFAVAIGVRIDIESQAFDGNAGVKCGEFLWCYERFGSTRHS
jgi:hypothetical protein